MESLRLQGQRWKSALPLLSSSRSSLQGSQGDASPLESLVESFRKNGSVFLSSLSVAEDVRASPSACTVPFTVPHYQNHYQNQHHQYQQHQQPPVSPNSSSCFESCDGGDVGFDSDNGQYYFVFGRVKNNNTRKRNKPRRVCKQVTKY